MKYEFKKIDEDTTELRYKDKVFPIKKDIDLLTKFESLEVRTKKRMMLDLAKEGLTTKDFEVEKKDGSKTYIDKSNLISLEKSYLDLVSVEILSEITQKYTQMSLTELLQDVEINISDAGTKEQEKFVYDFLVALRGSEGKTPSKKETENVL